MGLVETGACAFCDIIAFRADAARLTRWDDALAIVPLKPVTQGHIIVMPLTHVTDALQDPEVTAATMRRAAEIASRPCNIITSAGPAATQSVWHLHVHIVPRRAHDGLLLPWGDNEAHMRQYMKNACAFYSGDVGQEEER